MVNVFIIHSGKNYTYIKKRVEPYLQGKIDDNLQKPENIQSYANILTLPSGDNDEDISNDLRYGEVIPVDDPPRPKKPENNGKNKGDNWKREAKKLIKMAQVVIVVIGSDVGQKRDTLGWEVEQALKNNKQIMIFNLGSYDIPDYLKRPDRFTRLDQPIAAQQTLKEIKTRIDNFSKGYYNIFSEQFAKMENEERAKHKNELLDQYKMFQKSSEDLVSRRQSVNSFYISVNSALATLIGGVMALVEFPSKLYIMLFMCVVGIILDFSWIHILDAYGTLNGAKMKVIRLMEKQLPIALYDVEWKVMSDKLNNKKYVSFTDSEKRIPIIFAFVYAAIIIISAVILILSVLRVI